MTIMFTRLLQCAHCTGDENTTLTHYYISHGDGVVKGEGEILNRADFRGAT